MPNKLTKKVTNILHYIESAHAPHANFKNKKTAPPGYVTMLTQTGSLYPASSELEKLNLDLHRACLQAGVTIERGTYTDYEMISELVHNESLVDGYQEESDQIDGFFGALSVKGEYTTVRHIIHHVFILKKKSDEVIGLLHFYIEPNGNCELQTLSISPQQQKKGYGSLLIAFTILEAFKKSCLTITDNCNIEIHSMKQLYGFGFVPNMVRKAEKDIRVFLAKEFDEQFEAVDEVEFQEVILYLSNPYVQEKIQNRFNELASKKFSKENSTPLRSNSIFSLDQLPNKINEGTENNLSEMGLSGFSGK